MEKNFILDIKVLIYKLFMEEIYKENKNQFVKY